MERTFEGSEVGIRFGAVRLNGTLTAPASASGIVLFAHGSGSGRHSPRNRSVAAALNEAGFATLLMDLLTQAEESRDQWTGEFRFDIKLLADRLAGATDWIGSQKGLKGLPIGYFGASTGAAAALIASTERRRTVRALVSRGGRPDLAGHHALSGVTVPALFIVGGEDIEVLRLNRQALSLIPSEIKKLTIIPGAGHLFEEPGALRRVAEYAVSWFSEHLKPHQGFSDRPSEAHSRKNQGAP